MPSPFRPELLDDDDNDDESTAAAYNVGTDGFAPRGDFFFASALAEAAAAATEDSDDEEQADSNAAPSNTTTQQQHQQGGIEDDVFSFAPEPAQQEQAITTPTPQQSQQQGGNEDDVFSFAPGIVDDDIDEVEAMGQGGIEDDVFSFAPIPIAPMTAAIAAKRASKRALVVPSSNDDEDAESDNDTREEFNDEGSSSDDESRGQWQHQANKQGPRSSSMLAGSDVFAALGDDDGTTTSTTANDMEASPKRSNRVRPALRNSFAQTAPPQSFRQLSAPQPPDHEPSSYHPHNENKTKKKAATTVMSLRDSFAMTLPEPSLRSTTESRSVFSTRSEDEDSSSLYLADPSAAAQFTAEGITFAQPDAQHDSFAQFTLASNRSIPMMQNDTDSNNTNLAVMIWQGENDDSSNSNNNSNPNNNETEHSNNPTINEPDLPHLSSRFLDDDVTETEFQDDENDDPEQPVILGGKRKRRCCPTAAAAAAAGCCQRRRRLCCGLLIVLLLAVGVGVGIVIALGIRQSQEGGDGENNSAKDKDADESSPASFNTGSTAAPTIAPSAATSPPTIPWDRPVPPGPYVTALTANEMVVIPRQEISTTANVDDTTRTNCPWQAEDTVSWHDDSTWINTSAEGKVPHKHHQDVTLPAGKRVVISSTLADDLQLGALRIPSDSELIIADPDASDEIHLHVKGMIVHGKLTIGTDSCPIQDASHIVITLHGTRPSDIELENTADSTKGIHVTKDGHLSIHGGHSRRFPSWTRLARTAEFNDTAIVLQDNVIGDNGFSPWKVGQDIVIVTSALKDSRDAHQNEVRVIEAIHPNPQAEGTGTVLYLNEPLKFRHVANTNYQVEVALLSRIIRIQGSEDDSKATDPDPLNCILDRTLYDSDSMGTQCPDTETTGYGGHIMVEGTAQVQGVELLRMGQTNVQGRYPMHFHKLGDKCGDDGKLCYFKDSSVHQAYYRCCALHSTNGTVVTNNVCYDVIGYAMYLEEGLEMENTLSFNLVAHVHWLGPEPAHGSGQQSKLYQKSNTLTLPADVTASPFYISNVHNNIIGNAVSGGWAGYHFPNFDRPFSEDVEFYPSSVVGLSIDGNTAHSTGFWWGDASAFYIGGGFEYDADGKITGYQAGRGNDRDQCLLTSRAPGACKTDEFGWTRISNSKVFLLGSIGLNSWSGRFDIDGFEAHDTGMILQALARGFWMNRLLHVCRTGEPIALPDGFNTRKWDGSSLRWYDTGQDHIITNSVFRNCGLRANSTFIFNQYEDSFEVGCEMDRSDTGCDSDSSVWVFNSHSDMQVPEIMQATKNIKYENCGRRFKFNSDTTESVSARNQNWLDYDGSASGLGEYTLIVSGIEGVSGWWNADDEAIWEPQAPLWFIKKNDGPHRSLAHVTMAWDESLHSQVSKTGICFRDAADCPIEGYVRHLGKRFTPKPDNRKTFGMPLTASAEIVGLSGGYGWYFEFNRGAPKEITFSNMEIDPESVLVVSIPYPTGITFTITAESSRCNVEEGKYTCLETFEKTSDIEEVRSLGNKYHVNDEGVLTLRLSQVANDFVGNPEWTIPTWDMVDRHGAPLLFEYEREGVRLPWFSPVPIIKIVASCEGEGRYCSGDLATYNPEVCPDGYTQVGYDRCCRDGDTQDCVYPSTAE